MGCFVDDLVYFGKTNRSKNQKHRYYIPQGWWSMIQMLLVIQIGTARPSPFLDNTLPSGAPDEMEDGRTTTSHVFSSFYFWQGVPTLLNIV